MRVSGPKKKKKQSYHDFVIKNGRLIGDFEGLYTNEDDPWHQTSSEWRFDSRRVLALNWCERLREKFGANKVVELGCGFGYLTEDLRKKGFNSLGIDISSAAILKAKTLHPDSSYINSDVSNFSLLSSFDADIYILADITWYILDKLEEFIKNIKSQSIERERGGLAHS
jgi:trans-aconitate methyltransferase